MQGRIDGTPGLLPPYFAGGSWKRTYIIVISRARFLFSGCRKKKRNTFFSLTPLAGGVITFGAKAAGKGGAASSC